MSERRILYVTYNLPRVPATGGLTRAYHLVRAAAEQGAVTLIEKRPAAG